jgi:hypothetical protein
MESTVNYPSIVIGVYATIKSLKIVIFQIMSKKVIVVGNCCIKKFLPKNKQCRTCDICCQPHKNRKVNHCNQCRLNFCYDCDTLLKNKAYKRCYDCHIKKYIYINIYTIYKNNMTPLSETITCNCIRPHSLVKAVRRLVRASPEPSLSKPH